MEGTAASAKYKKKKTSKRGSSFSAVPEDKAATGAGGGGGLAPVRKSKNEGRGLPAGAAEVLDVVAEQQSTVPTRIKSHFLTIGEDPRDQFKHEFLTEFQDLKEKRAEELKARNTDRLKLKGLGRIKAKVRQALGALLNNNAPNEARFLQAVGKGNDRVVRRQLRNGVNVDVVEGGKTALHVAAHEGHLEVATTLLNGGAALDARTPQGWTPLHEAAALGHGHVVRLLLRGSLTAEGEALTADPNAETLTGSTPLMKAATAGSEDVAELLLNAGGDVDNVDQDGMTALHYACWKGHPGVVRLLLEYGGRIDIKDKHNFSPDDWARAENNHGAQIAIQDHVKARKAAIAAESRGPTLAGVKLGNAGGGGGGKAVSNEAIKQQRARDAAKEAAAKLAAQQAAEEEEEGEDGGEEKKNEWVDPDLEGMWRPGYHGLS